MPVSTDLYVKETIIPVMTAIVVERAKAINIRFPVMDKRKHTWNQTECLDVAELDHSSEGVRQLFNVPIVLENLLYNLQSRSACFKALQI